MQQNVARSRQTGRGARTRMGAGFERERVLKPSRTTIKAVKEPGPCERRRRDDRRGGLKLRCHTRSSLWSAIAPVGVCLSEVFGGYERNMRGKNTPVKMKRVKIPHYAGNVECRSRECQADAHEKAPHGAGLVGVCSDVPLKGRRREVA